MAALDPKQTSVSLRAEVPVWGEDVAKQGWIEGSMRDSGQLFGYFDWAEYKNGNESRLLDMQLPIEIHKLFHCDFVLPSPTTNEELRYPITRLLLSPNSLTSASTSTVQRILLYPHREKLCPVLQIDDREYELDYHKAVAAIEELASGKGERERILKEIFELWKKWDGTRWEFSLRTTSTEDGEECEIQNPYFQFDDFASHRQPDIFSLRRTEEEESLQLKAEEQGMFYLKYPGLGAVGCFGYGAGLSMSTLDAVINAGGEVANFFDGGGGANAQNAYEGIKILAETPGVKVLFVNIFGGLTRCDWVAEGITKAVREINEGGRTIPVVVRMKGTMSEEGNRYLREQNLPIIIEQIHKLFHCDFVLPSPTTDEELRYPITRLLLSPNSLTPTSTSTVQRIVLYPHREKLCPVLQIDDREYELDYHKGVADIEELISGEGERGRILGEVFELWKKWDGTRWEFSLRTTTSEGGNEFEIRNPYFQFDDFASHRQPDIFSLRRTEEEESLQLKAEEQGMFYIKYPGLGAVGCFGYGAGLSMSTLDAVINAGGEVANFFDGGGGANAQNAYEGIKILAETPGVKVLFVNIFGGLTRCDWVAEGITKAVREINEGGRTIPVVVRMKGTMSEEGNRYLREQNLPIIIEPDFEQAAKFAVEASKSAVDKQTSIDVHTSTEVPEAEPSTHVDEKAAV
ncbi:succinyl-CoA synthetase-like protein [Atractiella rhizophila]|nr:succinyl-CoA synthetase-like protein [Atractiella rhizophila]